MTIEDIEKIDKLSTFAELALADLDKARDMPQYEIDFGEWHLPICRNPYVETTFTGVCKICLAGGVMAGIVGYDPSTIAWPAKFPTISDRLQSLDALRCGSARRAIRLFNNIPHSMSLSVGSPEFPAIDYDDDFSKKMQPRIDWLKENGY